MLTLAVISPVEFRGHANRPPLRPALCTPCHLSLSPAELTPLTKWLSSTLACIIWCLTVAKVLWKINNLESLGANRRRRRKRENGIMCLRLPIEETRGVTARAYSFWWDNALLLWEQSPLTLLGKNVPHTWHQIVLLIKKACNGQQLVCPNLCKWGKLSKAVIKPFMLVSKKKKKTEDRESGRSRPERNESKGVYLIVWTQNTFGKHLRPVTQKLKRCFVAEQRGTAASETDKIRAVMAIPLLPGRLQVATV